MSAETAASPCLYLDLYRGNDALPERFTVYARREVAIPGGRAVLHVIGASSLVVMEAHQQAFSEVIACGEPDPSLGALLTAPVPPVGSVTCRSVECEGLRYTVQVRSVPLPGPTPPASGAVMLEHRFDGPGQPLTRIELAADASQPSGDARASETKCVLWTRHDYPEFGLAVLTESVWELANGPSRFSPRSH